jgi:sugar lactone lactonase YvrE
VSAIECVVAAGNRLGESPVWDGEQQKLFWIDGRAPEILSYAPATGQVQRWPAPASVGSIGMRRDGGLVVAMKGGFYVFSTATGRFTRIAEVEADRPDNRFNDGRCDRGGRFWAGTMNDTRREPDGSLYRLDPNGNVQHIRGDLVVPNSICWSLDDRTMYLADTYRHRIYAYDYDIDSGAATNLRIFVDATGHPGRPDGSTVDSEGCLWNAEFAGGRVVRYAPDGRIDRVLEMPVSQPTSCSFGGPDLATLYVTSATQRLSDAELAAQPLAGALFAVDVGVRGVPEPQFWG